jgi:hypothetical protein
MGAIGKGVGNGLKENETEAGLCRGSVLGLDPLILSRALSRPLRLVASTGPCALFQALRNPHPTNTSEIPRRRFGFRRQIRGLNYDDFSWLGCGNCVFPDEYWSGRGNFGLPDDYSSGRRENFAFFGDYWSSRRENRRFLDNCNLFWIATSGYQVCSHASQ